MSESLKAINTLLHTVTQLNGSLVTQLANEISMVKEYLVKQVQQDNIDQEVLILHAPLLPSRSNSKC